MTHAAVAMVNLLGDRWNVGEPHFDLVPTDDFVHLHLYGKKEARSDRKMGHITITGDDLDSVTRRAIGVRNTITR